jgi:hypothetical protein
LKVTAENKTDLSSAFLELFSREWRWTISQLNVGVLLEVRKAPAGKGWEGGKKGARSLGGGNCQGVVGLERGFKMNMSLMGPMRRS